jgi:hypothetical protein
MVGSGANCERQRKTALVGGLFHWVSRSSLHGRPIRFRPARDFRRHEGEPGGDKLGFGSGTRTRSRPKGFRKPFLARRCRLHRGRGDVGGRIDRSARRRFSDPKIAITENSREVYRGNLCRSSPPALDSRIRQSLIGFELRGAWYEQGSWCSGSRRRRFFDRLVFLQFDWVLLPKSSQSRKCRSRSEGAELALRVHALVIGRR